MTDRVDELNKKAGYRSIKETTQNMLPQHSFEQTVGENSFSKVKLPKVFLKEPTNPTLKVLSPLKADLSNPTPKLTRVNTIRLNNN